MNYVVAVRALCAFTAKHGDLDLRFTPSPSAQEGMAGHAVVASRRGEGYESEVTLVGDYKELRVRGRADGYDSLRNQLEEVKTFRGDIAHIPDNHRALHWAQVKIYGWLLCRDRALHEVRLALVYFDIASMQETVVDQVFNADELRDYFEAQCEIFLVWARQEMAHRTARDAALTDLGFPHQQGFRPGQRELAEAVYKAGTAGRCLMAQAPTGIGKTIGTLFPLLKTAPRQQLDKIFFLTAKTPGRKLALDSLDLLKRSAPAMPLRVLELVARDKACEHSDKACHGESCPLAQGFYDRLPAARTAAVALASRGTSAGPLDRERLRRVALQHGICPYYLSQDLVPWSDVVVGDYNYYFDTSAMLHSQVVNNQWKVSVLVDEAHNLVERARSMYSAVLDQRELALVQATAPRGLRRIFERLSRSWDEACEGQQDNYQTYPDVHEKFLQTLQYATSALTDHLDANPSRVDAVLQNFYFELLHFARMADSFGQHSIFDITLAPADAPPPVEVPGTTGFLAAMDGGQATRLCIRNVVPAPFLAPRFAAARSVTLFSATLSPQNYYTDTLGLPENTAWVDVQSPFAAEQLSVQVVTDVSTRWRDRAGSLSPIADLVARQYTSQPGNYLVFLSSYDYLQKLVALFRRRYPGLPVLQQTQRMHESARDDFLAQFAAGRRGIGFAVLGGAFAEGIDLPGDRLIGAFIATLGLPQVNPVNEEIKARMGANFGSELAYDYTYLYPGLQKVVQAAGRVIRTTSDRGVVYLIDDRFTRPEVHALLPLWWQVQRLRVRRLSGPVAALRDTDGSDAPVQDAALLEPAGDLHNVDNLYEAPIADGPESSSSSTVARTKPLPGATPDTAAAGSSEQKASGSTGGGDSAHP